MAELTITPENVRLGANTKTIKGESGGTLTPMMPVYLHADGDYRAAANTSALLADCKGLIIGYGDDGETIEIAQSGLVTVGATLTVNTLYVIGSSGKIMPYGDLTTGDFGTVLGWATTTAVLNLQIQASGVATP
jgi:hypothetical protein